VGGGRGSGLGAVTQIGEGCYQVHHRGSVPGPVLFLVFINDLDEGLMSNIMKFADDTKTFGPATTDGDRQIIQNDLTTLAS
jgi:hypothetical protein